MKPEVTVIIPNYNGRRLLENCIRTLENQTCSNFKVLVIDNGSTDGSAELSSDTLSMETVRFSRNTGFCIAVNEGLCRTDTPYAILLNNDTEAEPYFVEALLSAIKKDKRIFSCSAKMINYGQRDLIDNAGDYYTVLGWAVARAKGLRAEKYDRPARIFSSCGGAAIYRMSAIKEVGLLDEQHFAYLEDVDLGYRARIFGYKNVYEPKAVVYHVGSATTGTRYNEKKVYLAARNSMYVIRKNMPPLQILVNLPFLMAGVGIKYLFFQKKGFSGEYLRGIRAGLSPKAAPKKVSFQKGRIFSYLGIEAELFWNILRILLKI